MSEVVVDATATRPNTVRVSIGFAAVVVASLLTAVRDIVPGLPRSVANAVTIGGLLVSLSVGYAEYRSSLRGVASRGTESAVPGTPPGTGQGRVRPMWLGATLLFVVLSLALPVFAPVAVFTGLMAFGLRRVAAGLGLASVAILLAIAALLMASDVWPSDPPPPAPAPSESHRNQDASVPVTGENETTVLAQYFTSLLERCSQGMADTNACLAIAAGEPALVLQQYGYVECRQLGESASACVRRLP